MWFYTCLYENFWFSLKFSSVIGNSEDPIQFKWKIDFSDSNSSLFSLLNEKLILEPLIQSK
mgnify:CR=1 FL=1